MDQNSENKNQQPEHKLPKKVGWKFAAATAGLGAVTATAAFNGAAGLAIAAGIGTGIALPITAYVLFAEGMNA